MRRICPISTALGPLVHWLLIRDYDVRLLIGDVYDVSVTRDFMNCYQNGLIGTRGHLFNEPDALSISFYLKLLLPISWSQLAFTMFCYRYSSRSQ